MSTAIVHVMTAVFLSSCGFQTERWVSLPGKQWCRDPGLGHSCPVGVWWGQLWGDNRRGQKFHQLPAQQGHQVRLLMWLKDSPESVFTYWSITSSCVLLRRRMSCEEALAHPWMAAFDSEDLAATKCLSKEKMKRFLARQKWKVTHPPTWLLQSWSVGFAVHFWLAQCLSHRKLVRPCLPWRGWLCSPEAIALCLLPALEQVP